MSDSILTSTKVALGIEEDDPSFDPELIMFINAVFLDVSQLGVGPALGFEIQDAAATWDQLLGEDLNLNAVKTLVHLKVRLIFDPPSTGPLTTAVEKLIDQMVWRINVHRETTSWVDPSLGSDLVFIDGGVG